MYLLLIRQLPALRQATKVLVVYKQDRTYCLFVSVIGKVKDDFICDGVSESGTDSGWSTTPLGRPAAPSATSCSLYPNAPPGPPMYDRLPVSSTCGENVPWLQRLSPHAGSAWRYDSKSRVLASGSLVTPVLVWLSCAV